jgi:hypothetical protein
MQSTTPSKQRLHDLIEQLPEAQADAVLAFAQVLNMDPVRRAILFAPDDDEPVTPEEEADVASARHQPRVRLDLDELLTL